MTSALGEGERRSSQGVKRDFGQGAEVTVLPGDEAEADAEAGPKAGPEAARATGIRLSGRLSRLLLRLLLLPVPTPRIDCRGLREKDPARLGRVAAFGTAAVSEEVKELRMPLPRVEPVHSRSSESGGKSTTIEAKSESSAAEDGVRDSEEGEGDWKRAS